MAVSWNDVAVRAWPGKEQDQHSPPREILNRRCGDAACGDVSNVPRTRDVTPSQTCLHTQGHCPCLVPLSLDTPAGTCLASLCHSAWIILDLPSNMVWESSRAKDPSTGTGQQLCAPAAHQPRVGASTKTSPRSAAASLSPAMRDMGAATRPLHPLPLL